MEYLVPIPTHSHRILVLQQDQNEDRNEDQFLGGSSAADKNEVQFSGAADKIARLAIA